MDRDREALDAAWKKHKTTGRLGNILFQPEDFQAGWQAALAYAREGREPAAWMRKWAADGVNVMKLKKEDRPRGWAMHAVTVDKLLPDDVPLAIGSPSPVTESSGGVFRDLNVSPPESGSWFTEDVRRASERQEKIAAMFPSRRASPPVVIGVDLAGGPDTAAWYCPTCGSSGVVKPGSPLNVSPPEKD